MFDFHEKRKIRSFLYSKVVIAGLFLVAMALSFPVYNRYTVAQDMKAKLETKRIELEEIKLRAQTLESKVDYLGNERGVEEELRNRFDVAKEGEQVIILLDDREGEKTNVPENSSAHGTENDTESKKSFFDFFKFQ